MRTAYVPVAQRRPVRSHARELGDVYNDATVAANGSCPIESGLLLSVVRLADLECKHDRLPFDRTPPCSCWPEEVATDPALVAERVTS